MSHRPLSKTSSLKITAAYCTGKASNLWIKHLHSIDTIAFVSYLLKKACWKIFRHLFTYLSADASLLAILGCTAKNQYRKFEQIFPFWKRVFWAPNGTRLSARCYFTGPKKFSNSRAQPPPTPPRNGYARIQNIIHGAV